VNPAPYPLFTLDYQYLDYLLHCGLFTRIKNTYLTNAHIFQIPSTYLDANDHSNTKNQINTYGNANTGTNNYFGINIK